MKITWKHSPEGNEYAELAGGIHVLIYLQYDTGSWTAKATNNATGEVIETKRRYTSSDAVKKIVPDFLGRIKGQQLQLFPDSPESVPSKPTATPRAS
jgi:hypothetical protein